MRALIPTEDEEQTAFVTWLDLKGYRYWRTPNETFTRSWRQRAKNKRLGVRKGVPDLFVIAHGRVIAIEMKRVKGSHTSPEQHKWIKALNEAGVPAFIAKGADHAIELVKSVAERR